jgi:hypothetical protein
LKHQTCQELGLPQYLFFIEESTQYYGKIILPSSQAAWYNTPKTPTQRQNSLKEAE